MPPEVVFGKLTAMSAAAVRLREEPDTLTSRRGGARSPTHSRPRLTGQVFGVVPRDPVASRATWAADTRVLSNTDMAA